MIFPYGIQSYRRADLPRIRLVNQFVEKVPSSKVGMALLARPGLAVRYDIGDGPIRGVFQKPGALLGALFAVSGDELYSGTTAIGTIGGTVRVSMSATVNELMIANDIGLYIYDGATLHAPAFPQYPGVDYPVGASSVGYLNGITFASQSGTRRLYFTQDPLVWDDLDYVAAETSTGNIVSSVVVSDQVWVFCEEVTEVFVTTGDGAIPFQRVEGRLYDKGCLARDTIVKMDNSVIWVGHDGIVYRGDSVPTRISDHGIEERISASDASDLRAWSFAWVGHNFYCLTTSDGTVAFDAATGQWAELASYGRSAWRAHLGQLVGRTIVAGDDELGRLWELSESSLTDDGAVVERIFTGIIDSPLFIDNISLSASTGLAPDPTSTPLIEVRMSRDQGMTWGAWKQASLGDQGQYRKRAAWRGMGMADGDGAILEWRVTDETPWRLSDIKLNEALSGRGR